MSFGGSLPNFVYFFLQCKKHTVKKPLLQYVHILRITISLIFSKKQNILFSGKKKFCIDNCNIFTAESLLYALLDIYSAMKLKCLLLAGAHYTVFKHLIQVHDVDYDMIIQMYTIQNVNNHQ